MWIEKIRKAEERKKKEFQDDADEAMKFYRPPEGNYNFVYHGDINGKNGVGLDVNEPAFKMTLNKVAELVEIFGPILYAKNPTRQVNPRPQADIPPFAIPDPFLFQALMQQEAIRAQNDQLKSTLLATYQNWTPNELKLKDAAEKAIDEALIKGRGCLWANVVVPPGQEVKIVGSAYDSVDFLQIDPDAEKIEDAWWISRKRCQPVWEVRGGSTSRKGRSRNGVATRATTTRLRWTAPTRNSTVRADSPTT